MIVALLIWFIIILVTLILLMYYLNPKLLRHDDGKLKKPSELKVIVYSICISIFIVLFIGLALLTVI